MEAWNSANAVLFSGKSGKLPGSGREAQEVSVLALPVLQSALPHVNTLILKQILAEPGWPDDRRGRLRPLAAVLDAHQPLP